MKTFVVILFIVAELGIAACKKKASPPAAKPSDNHTSQMAGNHLWTGVEYSQGTDNLGVYHNDTTNRSFWDAIIVFSTTKIAFASEQYSYGEYDTLFYYYNYGNTVTFSGSYNGSAGVYFIMNDQVTYDFVNNRYTRQTTSQTDNNIRANINTEGSFSSP